MVNIHIIFVGKRQAEPYRALAETFLTYVKPYANVEMSSVKAEPFSKESERERIRTKEAERIRGAIPKGSVVVALDERGKEMDSKAFSGFLSRMEDRGDKLCFLVGGPLGLDPNLLGDARERIALSKMTLPHDLALLVLLEQLFRAFTIMKGRTYHY